MEKSYALYLSAQTGESPCELCAREPLQKFTHWKIITNHYPYDLIASEHHLLIPLRHVPYKELTREELDELEAIKESSMGDYDYMLEAISKSLPQHFHIHLIVGKGILKSN